MLSDKLKEEFTACVPPPPLLHIDDLDRAPIPRPLRPFLPLTDGELAGWMACYEEMADTGRDHDGYQLDAVAMAKVRDELRGMRAEQALRRGGEVQ